MCPFGPYSAARTRLYPAKVDSIAAEIITTLTQAGDIAGTDGPITVWTRPNGDELLVGRNHGAGAQSGGPPGAQPGVAQQAAQLRTQLGTADGERTPIDSLLAENRARLSAQPPRSNVDVHQQATRQLDDFEARWLPVLEQARTFLQANPGADPALAQLVEDIDRWRGEAREGSTSSGRPTRMPIPRVAPGGRPARDSLG